MRLGKQRLCLLATMASPFTLLIVLDKLSRSLLDRGLIEPRKHPLKPDDPDDKGGLFSVSPAGLRRLADAMERGELEQFFDPRFERDRVRLYLDGKKRGASA